MSPLLYVLIGVLGGVLLAGVVRWVHLTRPKIIRIMGTAQTRQMPTINEVLTTYTIEGHDHGVENRTVRVHDDGRVACALCGKDIQERQQ